MIVTKIRAIIQILTVISILLHLNHDWRYFIPNR